MVKYLLGEKPCDNHGERRDEWHRLFLGKCDNTLEWQRNE